MVKSAIETDLRKTFRISKLEGFFLNVVGFPKFEEIRKYNVSMFKLDIDYKITKLKEVNYNRKSFY